MKIINYISITSIPVMIVIVIFFGLIEKKKVYEIFMEGVKEGMGVVVKLFPTLLAIFLAVGMLRNSGIFEWITQKTEKDTQSSVVEILPLAIIRPISGSASIAMGTDMIKNYGVDSKIGKITATMMASTETTLYIIAIYTSNIKIKKTRNVLWLALIVDSIGMLASVVIWQFFP